MSSLRSPLSISVAVVATVSLIAASPAEARPPEAPQPPTPTFADATVHDPDHIEVDGVHYVFGSHLQAASSTDLVEWEQIAADVTPENPLFDDVTAELSEALTWAETETLWAPDVIQLADGRFYMYYNACRGDSPRSAMGIAVADEVTGPYEDLGLILKSGMWGQPSEDGTIYDATVHPNVVDPDVFFDADGRLWMVYGSFSGGIFILELNPSTGFPLPDQGYGKHLWGGNHARIEGPAVSYDPATGYYTLFVTYGGLDSTGGYNIRVARATSPDGPYLDAEGRDMAEVKADPAKPLFDDASIEESAVKLLGNHEFQRLPGDPGVGRGLGYVSPGGSSPFVDEATGQPFLAIHTRFPGRGEEHQIRVHEMYTDVDGWPVVAPLRYGGTTARDIKRHDVVGSYAVVDHAPRTIDTDIHQAVSIELTQQGKVTGAMSGTWERDGQSRLILRLGGTTYVAEVARQFDPDQGRWVTTWTALAPDGAALGAIERLQVRPDEAVERVLADLTVPGSAISDLALPTAGTQGSTIVWTSSDESVIAADGSVVRPTAGEPDATVELTATVTNGVVTGSRQFTVVVPARVEGGLVASYPFDGDLDAADGQTAGTVSGPRIGAPGGSITFGEGVHGQAVMFDGATGVRLPDGLVSAPTWSVSLWLKPTVTTQFTPTFFAARDETSWVSLLPSGHGGVGGDSMIWSGSAWYDAGFGQKLPVGAWSHVAFTVDSGKLAAWVDGTRVFEGTGFPDVLTTTDGVFSLGVNWWDAPYSGAMDELRVYNAPLSDTEVAELAAR
ncbi:LamG-like jellyroll fold domain-containing protein [Tessaracoccus sp. MC1756]|uniref:LamG-like jellyroll fold domain-containing protein n=1 Tax=Tessaracoccus sp. MC1756 TaxID=2760311 RepID=UPI00160385DF|nr:LamG-like jellyroll fold domain-containing protein [Tessaracoccus sp. MC1756]MBB1509290.1 family 43 glycosylhydrolase [Tessaracoccus sp. MC1756]